MWGGEGGKRSKENLKEESEVSPKTLVNSELATTYLLKLNLGYQMLFLTKRVKFSAAFKKAGLKKIITYC